VLEHDVVLFFGDLNYRLELPRADTLRLIEARRWSTLLAADQLRGELRRGTVLRGFVEARDAIAFAPTFKLCLDSEVGVWCGFGVVLVLW
jgi:hypothetical protein